MSVISVYRRPSIVLYSHDGFGLGHLSRTVYLARCIRDQEPGADILVLTSSPAAHRYTPLDDFEYIKLPSVTKTGAERYRPHNLHTSLESVIALRSTLLLSTLQHVRPDLLVVDHRPLGLKGEALPALQWIKECAPETRTAVGLRDVVDDPETTRKDWAEQGVYGALEDLYDLILVYGDRSILDSTREYAMQEPVAQKVHFTGYLGRERARRPRHEVRRDLGLNGERLVLVHAGGGADGTSLIETYLQSANQLPEDVHSLVVTGPLMDRGDRARLIQHIPESRVTVLDYQDDLVSCVRAADLLVCMGGYNTLCEALSTRVRTLVVPRVFPRKEQIIRAQRFADRGLVRLLHPSSLSPGGLAAAVQEALLAPARMTRPVPLDGGARAASLLTSLLPAESRSQPWDHATPVEAYG